MLPLASALALVFSLASCAVPDSDYAAHAAKALTSPKPDAIVGMWYHRYSGGAGQSSIGTTLFKPDGTGLSRVAMHGLGSDADTHDRNFRLTWKYDGGGWWSVTSEQAGGYADQVSRWRTDGTVMLYTDSGGVWVRADDTAAVKSRQGQ